MLTDLDKMSPYERQLLWIFGQAAKNSHELTVFQKEVIENRLQDIVDVWIKPRNTP